MHGNLENHSLNRKPIGQKMEDEGQSYKVCVCQEGENEGGEHFDGVYYKS